MRGDEQRWTLQAYLTEWTGEKEEEVRIRSWAFTSTRAVAEAIWLGFEEGWRDYNIRLYTEDDAP